ncbi:MAG TPA: hypothetical protein VNO81_07100 [Candidatus Nitrosotenuis sp.]|nr:hypothetical protein [Candidatus Nitrosotenuis sp.]
MPSGRERGLAMAVTLSLLAILAILGLAITAVGVQQLNFGRHQADTSMGLLAAEAGLEEVRAAMQADPSYGTRGESFEGQLPSTALRYFGSFSAASAAAPGLVSVNNLASSTAVTRPDGTVVPPWTADIIASVKVGRGQRVTVGMILTNRWDQAVSTTGNFRARGNLKVYGASTLQEVERILGGSSTGDMPGNILANSDQNPAVQLSLNSQISGVITTPGGVNPSSFTNVVHDTLPIPELSWSFYTPASSDPRYYELGASSYSNLTLPAEAGRTLIYRQGSLTVGGGLTLENCTLSVDGDLNISGGLQLRNATLYVNGDVEISGGIHYGGSGAATGSIFVCGQGNDIQVDGSADFSASNTTGVSIFCQDEIRLTGGASLQGVLYANGDLTATGGARVIGMAITNGNARTEVEVEGGATFIYCPVYLQALTQYQVSRPVMMKVSWRRIE